MAAARQKLMKLSATLVTSRTLIFLLRSPPGN
jgi:hypothetical protein